MLRNAIVIATLLGAAPAIAQSPQNFPGYMAFEGRALAVLSDADMVASAYLNGDLGPRTDAMVDELAIVDIAGGMPGTLRRIAVSNAVTAWPTLLALSADGRFAYVAETDSPAGDATTLAELRPSPVVRVVDIAAGRVVQEVTTAGRAQGLSLSAAGTVLAVNIVDTPTPQVGFLRIGADGQLGGFERVDLPASAGFPRDLAFSPDGTILAATFPAENEARFFRVDLDGDAIGLAPLGDAVVTGKLPGVGQWSPDARHYFITNLYWLGGARDAFVGSHVSTLLAVRVDPDGKHAVVSAAAMGASAENFAISPDGRTIVTLNMETSFLPPSDGRLSYHSSLTLMDWDPASERLVARTTVPFEGILPEGITFDASGRFIAVANFAHANPQRPAAETTVDIWRLVAGPEPVLVKTDVSIPVTRGAHVVKLVR